MNTYKKLAEQRDETKFILKTLKKRWSEDILDNEKTTQMKKLLLHELKELFELYEIK